MTKQYNYFVGIDPGLSGAISVIGASGDIEIYDMPVLKIPNPNPKAKSKTKNDIDIISLVDIFDKLSGDVIVYIEKVHSMPGQGNVSMFNFGVGYGIYKGIIRSKKFDMVEVSPQTWKKYFSSDLETDETSDLKAQLSDLRKKKKTLKGSEEKKANKKEQDKLNSQVKAIAKDRARVVASLKFASNKDQFKLKKHDGRADSALIALCCFENEK